MRLGSIIAQAYEGDGAKDIVYVAAAYAGAALLYGGYILRLRSRTRELERRDDAGAR